MAKKEVPKKELGIKDVLKKTWNFIWNDNSIWSWLVALVLAFIIVKFIFFPLISFILGTPLPLVVIESGSMHHQDGSLFRAITGIGITSSDSVESWYSKNGNWYSNRNITSKDFASWRYDWGMDKGDIVVVYGKKSKNIKLGDVIIFNAEQKYPIIHRVVKIEERNGKFYFATKGDNNADQLPIEKDISEDAILGVALMRIPKIGWIKLLFAGIIG